MIDIFRQVAQVLRDDLSLTRATLARTWPRASFEARATIVVLFVFALAFGLAAGGLGAWVLSTTLGEDALSLWLIFRALLGGGLLGYGLIVWPAVVVRSTAYAIRTS